MTDEFPLLPTPVAADGIAGSPERPSRAARPVDLPTVAYRLAQQQDDPLFPTPKAHDGVFGRPRTSGRPIEKSTHLGTIVTLLPVQEFDDGGGTPLLPTPTQSDGTGGGIRTGLSWDGTTKPTGDGGNSRLRDVVGLFVDDDTQETAMTEAPKTRPDAASGPTLRQAVDLTQGMLPLEFDSWEGVPDEWRPLVKDGPGMERPETTDERADWVVGPDDAVFPTPSAADVTGGGTDPEKTRAAGHRVKLIDAVLGDDLKGDPDPLFPTPNADQGRGTRTPDAVQRRIDRGDKQISLEDSVTLLPTPNVGASRTSNSPSEMSRNTPALGAVVSDLASNPNPLFPTPVAQDGNGHMQDLSADVGNNGRSVSLGDVAARLPKGEGPLPEDQALLPTPKTHQRGDCPSERDRRSPDLAATTHHFPAGRWGKYGPAVARWEALTRPAPAPTEPNKNGKPRLTAAFSEWLIGWPEGWVTDPEIGLSRTAQLRIVGNGVVPQQAYAAIAMLLKNLDEPAPPEDTHSGT